MCLTTETDSMQRKMLSQKLLEKGTIQPTKKKIPNKEKICFDQGKKVLSQKKSFSEENIPRKKSSKQEKNIPKIFLKKWGKQNKIGI